MAKFAHDDIVPYHESKLEKKEQVAPESSSKTSSGDDTTKNEEPQQENGVAVVADVVLPEKPEPSSVVEPSVNQQAVRPEQAGVVAVQ